MNNNWITLPYTRPGRFEKFANYIILKLVFEVTWEIIYFQNETIIYFVKYFVEKVNECIPN